MEDKLIAERTKDVYGTLVECRILQRPFGGYVLAIEVSFVPSIVLNLSFGWPYPDDLPLVHAFMNEFIERMG